MSGIQSIETGQGFKAAVLAAANLEREDLAEIFEGHSQTWIREMHALMRRDFVMFLAKLDPLDTERFWDALFRDEGIEIAETFGARARALLREEKK
jgi:hypothetical protein